MDKYKGLAIFVTSHEESKAVQEKLFSCGIKWPSGGASCVSIDYVPYGVIHVSEHLTATYSSVGYFERDRYSEYKGIKGISYEEFVALGEQHHNTIVCADMSGSNNPKAAIGSKSLPITMLSPLTCALGSLGKLNGKLKYGGANYIGTNVVFSVYLDAIRRHFDKILMGENCDAVDGVPHFGAILANIDIIVSAQAAGTLIDDRMRCDGQLEAVAALTPLVSSLQELHKDKNPKHYYMDSEL